MKSKAEFLKNVLENSIDENNENSVISVQDFINKLWQLERPQKDVCVVIKNNEKGFLKINMRKAN